MFLRGLSSTLVYGLFRMQFHFGTPAVLPVPFWNSCCVPGQQNRSVSPCEPSSKVEFRYLQSTKLLVAAKMFAALI
jgi:hypothetical protein